MDGGVVRWKDGGMRRSDSIFPQGNQTKEKLNESRSPQATVARISPERSPEFIEGRSEGTQKQKSLVNRGKEVAKWQIEEVEGTRVGGFSEIS